MKDSTYKPSKTERAKNFLKTGAVAGGIFMGGLLNSSDGYSQEFDSSTLSEKQKIVLQRGVLKPYFADSTESHYVFRFGLNSELEKAIKNTKKPRLHLMGEAKEGSYAKFNLDTSAVDLYYSKKHLGATGLGKVIGIDLLHEGGSINICEPYHPGSKTNHLSSLYWNPQLIKTDVELPGDTIQADPIVLPGDTIKQKSKLEGKLGDKVTIIDNSITKNYNYYSKQDTSKIDSAKFVPKCTDYRFLPETGKYFAKPFSFIGAVLQKNFGKNFWLGLYGRKNFGTEKTESREDWDITTPLEPEIGLETNSTGFKRTETELSKGLEGGLKFSYIPNNGILDAGIGFGAQETFKKIYELKKGVDNISQNEKIIQEKPFCVDSEEELSKLNYVLLADINANLFKGVSLGLEGRVNDLFNKPNIEAAVKASIEFGGCKNRKSLFGGRK